MSCFSCGDVDLSPCSSTIPVDPIPFKKCNPCKKVSCKQKLDSQCVIFKWNENNCGESLKYLPVQNNTSIEDVVEVIDNTFQTLTKPTLLNCFVEKSGINLTTYRINDVLTKLQEGYCQQLENNVSSIQSILETIRDTPELSAIFCEIVANCT